MTDTLKVLCKGQIPKKADSAKVIYTAPASTTAVVRKAVLMNKYNLGAYVRVVTDDTELINTFVPGLSTLVLPMDHNIPTADHVYAQQRVDMSNTLMTAATAVAIAQSTTDAASYATGSWTGQTTEAYVMAVINSHGSDAALPNGFTDTHTGISWQFVSSQQSITKLVRVSFYRAVVTGSNATTTTVTFAGNQTSCIVMIAKIVGADLTGSNGENAIQSASTYAPWNAGTVMTSPFVIPALGQWAGARLAVFAGTNAFASWSPGTGFTELFDASISEGNGTMEYAMTPGFTASALASVATTLTNPVAGMVSLQDPTNAVAVSLHGLEIS